MKKVTPISINGICTGSERTIPFGMFGRIEAKATHGGVGQRAVSWIANEETDENGNTTHSITVTLFTFRGKGRGKILSDEVTLVARRNTYDKCNSAMLQMLYERNIAIRNSATHGLLGWRLGCGLVLLFDLSVFAFDMAIGFSIICFIFCVNRK
jgi:hypothetical protein